MRLSRERYAVLDREVMPWGNYRGTRISKLPADYCKRALRDPAQLNPYLTKLLKLRIKQEENWLQDLQQDMEFYRQRAIQVETELERCQIELNEIRSNESDGIRSMLEAKLRKLRREYASKYHPDTGDGDSEMMAIVNQIFSDLEREVRNDG